MLVSAPHMKMEADPVTEKSCSLVFRIPHDGQSKKKTSNSEQLDCTE